MAGPGSSVWGTTDRIPPEWVQRLDAVTAQQRARDLYNAQRVWPDDPPSKKSEPPAILPGKLTRTFLED